MPFFTKVSLRQKILISYIVVVTAFIAVMYPLASLMVKHIVRNSLRERSSEIIDRIKDEPNDYALIQKLKDQRYLVFFRVSLITNERELLYDSYTRRLLGPQFNQNLARHPEVEQAFKEGIGFYEGESTLLKQKFLYTAQTFDFHGKTYALRTAFPYIFVTELTRDVEIGLIGLSIAALLLFSLMTWYIVNRLTQPIHQIITSVKPFQEGRMSTLPEIKIDKNAYDDVRTLANALNLLSAKIQNHIDTLTQERNETLAVLESLVEGVIAINHQQIITYANSMALSLLNFEREELIGHPIATINQKECNDLIHECQQSQQIVTNTVKINRDTSKTFLDIVAIPKENNSGAVLVMEDKSAHYKLLEMRKDFIANASHELKTPITIIRGFAETLHDNPDIPKETCAMITEKILHNCKRMSALVKDLLVLTDIENIPHSRLIDCDLYEIVQSCGHMIQDLYPDANVTINASANGDFLFTADPSLIELAVINLLENAAKYSKPPAQITITLDDMGDQIKLVIADRGIGIPKSDLEYIFQRFYTVNKAHSRKLGGSGLGLSIVETIVQKHGGKITVESEIDYGTSFTIIFTKHVLKADRTEQDRAG